MHRTLPLVLLLALPLAAAGPSHVTVPDPLGTQQFVHHLPDVQQKFADWEAEWPDLVETGELGTTTLGLPIPYIRITDESVPFENDLLPTGQKLRVYLDGGHHGNEYMGVELVMYFLEDLLNGGAVSDAGGFLRTHEVYAAPIINVEGNTLDTRKNINQVDVNRNYDYGWGGPGSGSTPADMDYRGPAPFSEPESRANAEFATSLLPDLWITMHTGIAEFYWPWGCTYDPAPDAAFFESLEKPFEDATNGRVDAMVAAELYLACGATDDWGYATLGVPTFTYEVHEDQFFPVYGEPIPQVIADQMGGLVWMVENTQRLGASFELRETEQGLAIVNTGWGTAGNITLDVNGKTTVVAANTTKPGDVLVMAEPGTTTVTYQPLLITSAPYRTATFEVLGDDVDTTDTPFVPVLLVGLVLVGLAARRRG